MDPDKIFKRDEAEDVNSNLEVIPTYYAWMTPDVLRERAREVGHNTDAELRK